jgi:hypothetical protein
MHPVHSRIDRPTVVSIDQKHTIISDNTVAHIKGNLITEQWKLK